VVSEMEILRRRGVLKAKIFKGKYEPKREFPEGWGSKPKKTLRGGSMDIFWNNTMYRCRQKKRKLLFPSCQECLDWVNNLGLN